VPGHFKNEKTEETETCNLKQKHNDHKFNVFIIFTNLEDYFKKLSLRLQIYLFDFQEFLLFPQFLFSSSKL
jgi:hypothetical protein